MYITVVINPSIHLYFTHACMHASRDECCSWGLPVDGDRLKVEDGRS